jgi:phage terminase large subunit-like protein
MWRRFLVAAFIGVALVNNAFTYHQYAVDVRSGEQVACKWTRLAVDRWFRDLDRQGTDDFPYVFDEPRAQRYISFAHQLEHTQGFSGKIELEPWQQFAWANIFGWVHRDTGLRRFTKAYREVARKNGKTVEGGAMMNAAWHLDGEIGAEQFFLAVDRNQARKAYDEAVRQNTQNRVLAARVKEYRSSHRLTKLNDPAAFMTPVSRDHKSQDSWNPHAILVDEYHAHPTNELINVYESGMGARKQPLTLIITTAGTNTNGPAYQEERNLITKILEGSISPVPEHIWGIIYTLDDGDRWEDPSVWVKSNPNLGVSFYREYLEKRISEAQGSPRKASDVLTKNFNVWLNSETRWMDHSVWMRGSAAVNEEKLEGSGACGGLDLSMTTDITALCWAFPEQEDGRHPLLWRFFIPEDELVDRAHRDQVDYAAWIRAGYMIATPGQTVDYDVVLEVIREDANRFGARSIGYDPWHAGNFERELDGEIELIKYPQRYSGMAVPTQLFERYVIDGKIAHGDNPVAAWMMSNVELKEDRQGNIMPMKPRRDAYGKRIDGIVAAIMALHQVTSGDGYASNAEWESLVLSRGIT